MASVRQLAKNVITLTDHVSALSPEKSSCGFRASRRNFLATAH
jgi:hypothetical protein